MVGLRRKHLSVGLIVARDEGSRVQIPRSSKKPVSVVDIPVFCSFLWPNEDERLIEYI